MIISLAEKMNEIQFWLRSLQENESACVYASARIGFSFSLWNRIDVDLKNEPKICNTFNHLVEFDCIKL